MTLSEVPLDVLNRFAATKLGWRWDNQRYWISPEGRSQHEQPKFETGDGMKMLLERMANRGHLVLSGTKLGYSCGTIACGATPLDADIGRAVLMAFCISEGFQVEGA